VGWDKPSPGVQARFAEVLPNDTRIERRRMFGCPCAFCGGYMFAGVFEQSIVLRLPAARREALLAAGSGRIFEAMGRVMREYLRFDEPILSAPQQMESLCAEALAFVAALPPKPPKVANPARKRTARGPKV
jgi:TfoX/Sxy family transcriptional regulator of competence genes